MDTVGQVLIHSSGQLSDQQKGREFQRWPRKVMLEYLNQGIKEIAAYRPDAFSYDREVTLQPGARQEIETTGTVDSLTVNGKPVNKTDLGIYRAFSAYATCPTKVKMRNGRPVYYPRSVSVDSDQFGVFYISPAVPPGLEVKAAVRVVGEPPEYTLREWGTELAMQSKYLNNLIDYVMARAYKRDTESQVSEMKSQRLFSLFYQSMGQKYKIDSAHGSGFYKGNVGTGDPRAAAT